MVSQQGDQLLIISIMLFDPADGFSIYDLILGSVGPARLKSGKC